MHPPFERSSPEYVTVGSLRELARSTLCDLAPDSLCGSRIRVAVDSKNSSTRVYWRSPQLPFSRGCPLLDTHAWPLLEELAYAGRTAFQEQGFAAINVLDLTMAATEPRWWYTTSKGFQISDRRWVYDSDGTSRYVRATGRNSTDIHSHEASTRLDFEEAAAREGCTAAGRFAQESRVYGWLSRVVTQMTLNRMCARGT